MNIFLMKYESARMRLFPVRIRILRNAVFFTLAYLPSIAVANTEVIGLVLGTSGQAEVESKYEIVQTAVISDVGKSVYELNVEQLDSFDIYTQQKPIEIALYFDKISVLSDVHLVYESWEYPQATEALTDHFMTTPDSYPNYGDRSIVFSWPSYQVVCFSDSATGYTHIIFANRTVDQ